MLCRHCESDSREERKSEQHQNDRREADGDSRAEPRRYGLVTRRQVLAGAGGLAAVAAFGGAGLRQAGGAGGASQDDSGDEFEKGSGNAPPLNAEARREEAYRIRVDAAQYQRDLSAVEHPDNGDEERYDNRIGSYSKGLPHEDDGEVNPEAYNVLLDVLQNGGESTSIPMGGVLQLDNPEAAYAFAFEGADSHNLTMEPAPELASAETAGEMVEAYWQALTRDVYFADYPDDELIAEAATDLSNLETFRGPKDDGQVTPETIFRGVESGELTGPYVSQFVWKDVPYGALTLQQRYKVPVAGDDFMTSYDEWLGIQRGERPSGETGVDTESRYIRNGRDLAELVHSMYPSQFGISSALILLSYENRALSPDNPFFGNQTDEGFATFGDPHVVDLVTRVYNDALKAAWYQKYLVHRRLRPEEFGGLVHNVLDSDADYPIHGDVLDSPVLERVYDQQGSYLLLQSYPEGSPAHSAYPSGHATTIGANITVLKACFDEDFVIPDPVMPNSDGTELEDYEGPDLTVGGELNKLASNIAYGRNIAGVHFRSDAQAGMRLGEAVAVEVLRDMKDTYVKGDFGGFFFTNFDGEVVEI